MGRGEGAILSLHLSHCASTLAALAIDLNPRVSAFLVRELLAEREDRLVRSFLEHHPTTTKHLRHIFRPFEQSLGQKPVDFQLQFPKPTFHPQLRLCLP